MKSMSKSEIRQACARAGGTCHTETGCTCDASSTKPLSDWVHGPSVIGGLDNQFGEFEQSMLPPKWLARLLIILAVIVILTAALV